MGLLDSKVSILVRISKVATAGVRVGKISDYGFQDIVKIIQYVLILFLQLIFKIGRVTETALHVTNLVANT